MLIQIAQNKHRFIDFIKDSKITIKFFLYCDINIKFLLDTLKTAIAPFVLRKYLLKLLYQFKINFKRKLVVDTPTFMLKAGSYDIFIYFCFCCTRQKTVNKTKL